MTTRKIAFFSGLILLFLVTIASCKKLNDPTTLGGDLIPAVDNVTTFERFLDIETDNFQLADSTKVGFSDDNALGVMSDPVFGTTTGEMYFSIAAPAYGTLPFKTTNADSVKVDSVVLSLTFSNIYGDSTSVASYQAFEIDQSADFDTTGYYYPVSTPPFATAGSLGSPETVYLDSLNNQVTLIRKSDTTTLDPHVRIHLDPSLFTRFLAYDTSATGAYKSDSLFKTYFKGIALKCVGGDNRALTYFTLNDQGAMNGHAKTGLVFYCRITQNGKTDTTSVLYPVTNRVTANLVRRDISGSEYAGNLGTPPPSANKQKLYLQSSPGSYATVRIKGLDTFQNVVVHRAEILINALPSQEEDIFTRPSLIFIDAIDSLGNNYRTIPIDFTLNNNTTTYNFQSLGGYFQGNKTFFNLTRYVQSIVTKHDSLYTLRLYAPLETNPLFSLSGGGVQNPYSFFFPALFVNPRIANGRVVIAGGAYADDTKRMKMRIVFSKI